ncbi:MAG: FAD-dependent oxidoreductase [Phycisphaerales bacterium]|nr:MAG: FAD-dependent oxidoreductase [Phycisphaerales bacterium]
MRIAIVGAGVSGLTCAYLLREGHEVTLFEREVRLGGHTNTLRVRHEGRDVDVDTGFIVFNERNYPNFTRLLARLGVASQPSTMTFSVRDEATGFEYGGDSWRGLFARRRNLVSPRFWSMARGVARFARVGKAMLENAADETTLGELFERGGWSRAFREDYLVPMASAIWSAPREATLAMPARFFLAFFDNHGMLDLRERPQWRTIPGGSRRYVEAMRATFADRVRLAAPVTRVRRLPDAVEVTAADGAGERYDEVIIAAHADEALAMLADATEAERAVLGAMPYQANEAVLHWDESLLPRRRAAWSGWNYRLNGDHRAGAGDPSAQRGVPGREPGVVPRKLPGVGVTYDLTILQSLPTTTHLCVTLNESSRIDPAKVHARLEYHHPLYTVEGMAARQRRAEVCGVNRTHYCGAYWGNGFHEDGVVSALRVCERFGATL